MQDSWSGCTRVEQRGRIPSFPCPAAHAAGDAAQGTVGLLGCECMLPGHVELLVYQHPQVLLLRAALNPFSAQPVSVLGIAPTQVQDLALGLVEPHEVHTGPPLQAVQVPLDGIPSIPRVDCLVLSANMLRMHSVPLPMSLTKMLNSGSANTDP